ncbi:MAG: hypothetical protein ACREX4_02930 [Gammaproteobacteria bacterium]
MTGRAMGILAVFAWAFAGHEARATDGSPVAFGGGHVIAAGSQGLPVRIFNPYLTKDAEMFTRGNEAQKLDVFLPLPFAVPRGKTLLLYGIFLESDPPVGEPMLMGVFVTTGGITRGVRALHIRQPGSYADNLTSPIPIPEGHVLNVMFSNAATSPQAFNWGIQARLVDSVTAGPSPTVSSESEPGQPWRVPSEVETYPPLEIHWSDNRRQELIPRLEQSAYVAETGSGANRVVLSETELNPARPANPGELVMNLSTMHIGRVRQHTGQVIELDNNVAVEPGHHILPVGMAKAGSHEGLIVDPVGILDCDQVRGGTLVVLTSGAVHTVDTCVPGQISALGLKVRPGDVYAVLPQRR